MLPTGGILPHSVVRRKGFLLATTNSFAKRLLEARLNYAARLGRVVGQTELARKLKVSPQSWSGWELGRTEPALAVIEDVAALLGVDPRWLAFGPQEHETNGHHFPVAQRPQKPAETSRRKRKGA